MVPEISINNFCDISKIKNRPKALLMVIELRVLSNIFPVTVLLLMCKPIFNNDKLPMSLTMLFQLFADTICVMARIVLIDLKINLIFISLGLRKKYRY